MFKWNESFQKKLDKLIALNEAGTLEGAHDDIPLEVYHHPMCPGVSKSSLKMAVTYNRWAHYLKRRLEEINDPDFEPKFSPDMLVGSAVHDRLFELERFNALYCKGLEVPSFGDKRVKANKEKSEEWTRLHHAPWLEQNQGKIALNPEQWDKVHLMALQASGNSQYKKLLDGAEFEVTFFYRMTPNGPLLKSRPDIVNRKKGLVYDHKTTNDAEVGAFKRTAKNFGYDLQMAMQIDGANECYERSDFMGIWGAQDRDNEPYDIAFYTPDDPTLNSARNWLVEKMAQLEAAKIGAIPKGYGDQITPIGITGWVQV